MTEASSIDGTENLYAIQLSDDRRLTPQQLADYVAESYIYNKENTDTTTVAGTINALEAALTSAANLLPKIYPVGAIYWSTKSTSPASLFGGTWTQIKDRFLLCAGSTYSAGSTGGEAAHTLTVAEMPSHNHGGATGGPSTNTSGAATGSTGNNSVGHTHSIPSLSGTAASAGGHTHTINVLSGTFVSGSTTNPFIDNSGISATGNLASTGAHTHTVTTKASTTGGISANHTHSLQKHTHSLNSHTHSITANGSSGAHNNMPPYTTYYCWERTA